MVLRRLIHAPKLAKSTPVRLFGSWPDLPEHRSLIVEKFGDPKESLQLKIRTPNEVLPQRLGPKQILVEHLMSTINPSDVNLIQGVYGQLPRLPSVVGNEGVTRVSSVGTEVTHLKPGDLALGVSITGNWQSYSVQEGKDFFKVDNDLELTTAAQLKVNPCSAYRMLKDFVHLKSGDIIIQNGATSAVGIYVIQLAKLWGFKTINIIRDKPNKDETIKNLKSYGANQVLTEAEVSDTKTITPLVQSLGKPKLFLNCVGGKNASNCIRTLDHGGVAVTYGKMSRQSYSVPDSAMIFKDMKLFGFWMSRWYQEQESKNPQRIVEMLSDLSAMFMRGDLRPKPTTLIDFEERDRAFEGSSETKYIFSINN